MSRDLLSDEIIKENNAHVRYKTKIAASDRDSCNCINQISTAIHQESLDGDEEKGE